MDLIKIIFKDNASNGNILDGMITRIKRPQIAQTRFYYFVVKGKSDEESWFKHR